MVDFSPHIRRRARVEREIGQGVLVLFAARRTLRNNDVTHEFRQDSDFYYLTGLDEPDAALVILGGENRKSILFVNPKDPEREVWDGPRLGLEGARALGADETYPITQLDVELPRLLEDRTQVICRFGVDSLVDERIVRALSVTRRQMRRGAGCPSALVDLATLVHELRRIKEDNEIELIERAIAISADAHRAAMAHARPGCYEYEIEALLRGAFRASGSERVAYEPIVGSGQNGTVLHYVKNQRQMQDGDLLLVDAGCEYRYYAADITRTFPVNGCFSPLQRAVYDVVLEAQAEAVSRAAPGVTLEQIHEAATRVICAGLIRLGVLAGSVDQALEEGAYKPYFMHKTSHYLGMDVHDVGRYFEQGKPRPLEPGVVITVEPGLYFSPEAPQAAAQFRGVGVRIEDDILIEAGGARVLSAAVPKQPLEVERACRSWSASA
jgi:Xaa-Pro aminopeptidase